MAPRKNKKKNPPAASGSIPLLPVLPTTVDLGKGKVTGLADQDDHYFVEEILDYKIENGQQKFLIKWEDWPEEYNTWEEAGAVDGCEEILADFFGKNAGAKALKDALEFGQVAGDKNVPLVGGGGTESPKRGRGRPPKLVLQEPMEVVDAELEALAIGGQQQGTNADKRKRKGKGKGPVSAPKSGEVEPPKAKDLVAAPKSGQVKSPKTKDLAAAPKSGQVKSPKTKDLAAAPKSGQVEPPKLNSWTPGALAARHGLLVRGTTITPYITEEMIKSFPSQKPFKIFKRDTEFLSAVNDLQDNVVIVVKWTPDDKFIRPVLESVAKKYFPEELDKFLEEEKRKAELATSNLNTSG